MDTLQLKLYGFIEEKSGNKYLIFYSTDENKEVIKNTLDFGIRLKMKLKQKTVVKHLSMPRIF